MVRFGRDSEKPSHVEGGRTEHYKGGAGVRMVPVEQRRKKYLTPPRRRGAVPLCLLLLAVAWLAREALGLGLVGGGCEMVRFGHDSEKPPHVEGGLSTLGFAIRVD